MWNFIGEIFYKISPFHRPIHIYTDGSHKGRWGSWAFVLVQNNKIIYETSGRVKKTNSHRMEFQAVIEALRFIDQKSMAHIYSDSKVLIDCFAIVPVRPQSNADQIEQIDRLIFQRKIVWKWVKAHSGVIFNERCDQLCILAREAKY